MSNPKRNLSRNIANDFKLIESLKQLSEELAYNYCTTSFGDKEQTNVLQSHLFNVPDNDVSVANIQRRRNILVIGAGASYDAYKCIPLGKQMADELLKRYENRIEQFDAIKRKYDKRIEDMKLERNGQELDFEAYMSLYSEFILTPEQVRDFLSEFTNYRQAPSLFYEIVAHMFKHSFIDVIINFNFDELLDSAIEEELGKTNYKFILTDGDCFNLNDAMVDGRLKIPVYIKPHGTVSQKTSLRFTKAHYLDMSSVMKEFIKEVVIGQRGNDKVHLTRINLICVGFNMESIEFKKILNDHLPYESRVYHFMLSDPNEESEDECYIQRLLPTFFNNVKDSIISRRTKSYDDYLQQNDIINNKKLADYIYHRFNIYRFKKENNAFSSPFSELFTVLWRLTDNQFHRSYAPRSISRHEIINYLFYDVKYSHPSSKPYSEVRSELRDTYEDSVTYFRDRVLVELAIAINRNNGVIDISEQLNDRVGLYYEKYRDAYLRSTGRRRGPKLYSIFELLKQYLSPADRSNNPFLYDRGLFRLKTLKKGDLINLLNESPDTNRKLKSIKKVDDKIRITDEIRDCLMGIIKDNNYFDNDNDVSPTVLYYLITCPLLSSRFIVSFKANYEKNIYNGKVLEKKVKNNSVKMIHELCRLFNKSTRNHYFQIKPKFDDRRNYLFESVSKNKIVTTNLSLEYNIRRIMSGEKWDRILTITEVGSFFHYLRHEENNLHGKFNLKDKKIIMLNALEAVYDPTYTNLKVNQQVKKNVNELFPQTKPELKLDNFIKAFAMPFSQHNHHMILFLKRVDKDLNLYEAEYPFFKVSDDKGYIMIGGFYMYRKGFSNQISPIYIGSEPNGEEVQLVKNDFHRLLSIFFVNYQRALMFQNAKDNSKYIVDVRNYNEWMITDSFYKKLVEFLEKDLWK